MSKSDHHWKEVAVENAIKRAEEHLTRTEKVLADRLELERNSILQLREAVETYRSTVPRLVDQLVREQTRELRSEIKELNRQLKERPLVSKGPDPSISEVKKASTICILDTILFAIENWTTDGQTAPDVTLASQSVLFSIVYNKVMSGDSDYYLDKFPVVSMEVIRRGREFVKYIREDSPVALTTEDVWDKYAPQLQEWWINDALPLIFGARDDGWIDEKIYSYDEMIKWRDMPQSRLLDFPKVSDGMDLVAKHMDNIREQIGLREFNLQQIQTRFNHE